MAAKKYIRIVTPGSVQNLHANSIGTKDFSKRDETVTWKKQVIEKEEVAKNPHRLLFNLEDKGSVIQSSKETSIEYKFKKIRSGEVHQMLRLCGKLRVHPSMNAFFMLQHYHGDGNKYVPFETEIIYKSEDVITMGKTK